MLNKFVFKSLFKEILNKTLSINIDKLRHPKAINSKVKIFVIGFNKTGTTSIEKCLNGLGYIMSDQVTGELFIDDYKNNDFSNIVDFCNTAEVFQDAPFSWPNTYKHIFNKFPDAKYILSERKSSEIWFNSTVRYHRKVIKNGEFITSNDLKKFRYRRKGWFWEYHKAVFKITENMLYDKKTYIECYERHNREVKEFFKDKENLLVINLDDKDSNENFARFMSLPIENIKFRHLNRST